MITKLDIAVRALQSVKDGQYHSPEGYRAFAKKALVKIDTMPGEVCGTCAHINILRIGMPDCKKKIFYPIHDSDREFCSRWEAKK